MYILFGTQRRRSMPKIVHIGLLFGRFKQVGMQSNAVTPFVGPPSTPKY